jgi:hypothetical protein
MKTAIFHNITNKPFIGFWDGKGKKYEGGARKLLPEYLAKHYATHLTNQILIEKGEYTSTSPKFPEQVPKFMDVFNQCYILQDDEEDDAEDVEMPIKNIPSSRLESTVDAKEVQIVPPVEGDDEDDFEGLKDKSSEVSPAKTNIE